MCDSSFVLNGPWAKAQYIELAQYTASTGFLGLGLWRSARGNIWAVAGPSSSPIEAVLNVVVGRISADKAYLTTNGTFNPSFGDPAVSVRNAKLQFSLECPIGDPDFESDFLTSYRNLEDIQARVATTSDRRYFLQVSGKVNSMRMNFPLWEEMVSL